MRFFENNLSLFEMKKKSGAQIIFSTISAVEKIAVMSRDRGDAVGLEKIDIIVCFVSQIEEFRECALIKFCFCFYRCDLRHGTGGHQDHSPGQTSAIGNESLKMRIIF